MRPVADIDADIASTKAALRKLHGERREAIRARATPIVADFDAGKDIAEIAKARELGYSTVQGILYRAGRTQGGRTAIRADLCGGFDEHAVSI
ncbi:MAG: hypothetical protein K9G48_13845 [Reyranella sp.]|nr:hypothetical protein [Reyranella sp.]